MAKQAAFNMAKELDSEMTDEQRERMEKSGMGIGGGVNKGEDSLFGESVCLGSASWQHQGTSRRAQAGCEHSARAWRGFDLPRLCGAPRLCRGCPVAPVAVNWDVEGGPRRGRRVALPPLPPCMMPVPSTLSFPLPCCAPTHPLAAPLIAPL
jgi:hypothetical protein